MRMCAGPAACRGHACMQRRPVPSVTRCVHEHEQVLRPAQTWAFQAGMLQRGVQGVGVQGRLLARTTTALRLLATRVGSTRPRAAGAHCRVPLVCLGEI